MFTPLVVLLSKVRSLFTARPDDCDFDEEVRAHLELMEEENVCRGMSPGEARRMARLRFGGPAQTAEVRREQRGMPQVETFIQDIRYGLRALGKGRGFTAVAIATLALGIGANTMLFSVVNTIFLKPLPYPEPDRLVNVWSSWVKHPETLNIISAPNFLDWQEQNTVFEGMALFDSAGKGYNLGGDKEAERVRGLRVSANLFAVLGVQPALGRTFLRDEETLGKNRVVVLSHGLWQKRYGGDPGLVGKTVRIDGEQYTVVGVMSPDFRFEFYSGHNELWVPVGFDSGDRDRSSNSFGACARLKPGITLAQARAEMDAIGRRVARKHPEMDPDGTVALTPLRELAVKGLRPTFVALFAAVGFVLLIACANVANLLLARGAARSKELAVRRALGASRLRIVRQLLTESVLLALLGGVAGLAVAASGIRLLERALPGNLRNLPFRDVESISLDARVFVFTLLVCCITGILFGLAAALTTLRTDVNDPLKDGRGRGTTQRGGRIRYALVATEVALALAVLTGAALMVESMARLWAVDPGLNPRNLLTMSVSLPQKVLYYSPPVRETFCRDLDEHAGGIPGVLSVSGISHLPIGGGHAGRSYVIDGQPDPGRDRGPWGFYAVACPGYFRTMAIPVLAGREFAHQDTVSAAAVAVVNQVAARRFWGNRDPVGSRIKIGGVESKGPWLTIVGVVGNVRHSGLDREAPPELYRPYTQAAWPVMTVVARTTSNPAGYTRPVRAALLSIDPDQAASGVETMDEVMHRSLGSRRLPTTLLSAFGLLALALAAVGIAGVVSYSVTQRTNEIGIRIALGARGVDVLRMVLGRTMAWTAAGVAAGIAGSFVLSRLLAGLLFGVRPMEPLVLAAVSLLLAAVALLAGYIPARRAARVDPIVALRYE